MSHHVVERVHDVPSADTSRGVQQSRNVEVHDAPQGSPVSVIDSIIYLLYPKPADDPTCEDGRAMTTQADPASSCKTTIYCKKEFFSPFGGILAGREEMSTSSNIEVGSKFTSRVARPLATKHDTGDDLNMFISARTTDTIPETRICCRPRSTTCRPADCRGHDTPRRHPRGRIR